MSGAPSPSVPREHVRVATPFGVFEIDTRDVVRFPGGLPGFEHCHRFVLLAAPALAPLRCLHALDAPAASFVVIEPALAVPGYHQTLTRADRQRVGATARTPLLWLAIVTIDGGETAHVNLRAPVVVNPSTMVGVQLMPSSSLYPLRYPLALPED